MTEPGAQPEQAIATQGGLERILARPGFQRIATILLAGLGLASAIAMILALARSNPEATRMALGMKLAPLAEGMQLLGRGMLIVMVLVGAVLALFLAWKGHRRPLTRLLACSCAGLSAIGVAFAVQLHFNTNPLRSADQLDRLSALFVAVLLLAILGTSIWIFSAAKFFIYFPKPVKLLGSDLDSPWPRGRIWNWQWNWFASVQFWALAAGVALIVLIDRGLDRLTSDIWSDAQTYFLCWVPFAVVSAKQKVLGEEDRRAIRWVLLGQSIWMVLFLLSTLVLFALIWGGVLQFANWNDSSTFVGGFLRVFFAGFVIVLMLGLAISILYDGSLDPDLMIKRTWVLAIVGLISGCLFVVLERLLATLIAQWLGISTVNAFTIVAAITASVIYPARSAIEAKVKGWVESWQSSHAIAEGERREAVIVFADLTGYTALTERNEREALIMAAIFHRDAQRIAKARRGHLIKTIGDAVMLRFDQVDDALQAVRGLKRDFDGHVRAMSMEPLRIHAGLHYGEVVIAPSGDVFGSTVNLAARILGAAGTDDIVASRAAIERASLAGETQFIGEKKFKNVEQPVGCFRVPEALAAA